MIADQELEKAHKNLIRNFLFYVIYQDRSSAHKLACRTSASSVYIKLSKKEVAIVWDLRFIEFMHHIFWGIIHFKDYLEIEGHRTTGDFHIRSAIWFRAAEKAVNPGTGDFLLSIGILYQESMFFHHSLPALTTHTDGIDAENQGFFRHAQLFEYFVFEHELAHHDFRTRKKADYLKDAYLSKLAAIKQILYRKYEDLQSRKDSVHPEILRMHEGLIPVTTNKMLFEEVLADTMALDTIFNYQLEINKTLPKSIVIWVMTQAVLTGLSALRLLAFSEIFIKAKTPDEFDELARSNANLYNTRKLFMEGMLTAHITADAENSGPERDVDFEFHRINELSHQLHEKVLTIEYAMKGKFRDGFVAESRGEGLSIQNEHALTEENLIQLTAEKLGWTRFYL